MQSGELTKSDCDNRNSCVAYIYHPAGTRRVYNPPNDSTLNLGAEAAYKKTPAWKNPDGGLRGNNTQISKRISALWVSYP
jgi:hypothetical protein